MVLLRKEVAVLFGAIRKCRYAIPSHFQPSVYYSPLYSAIFVRQGQQFP